MKTDSIFSILKKKYPTGEYVVLREVSNASGTSRSRSLDYMVINLWPSRGLSITGIELKVSRPDWLRELKNPIKQESHFKYCDYFYLLTDSENVADDSEIPESWGWMVISGNKIVVKKQAPKLNPAEMSRHLLCAMLKRADEKEGYILRSDISQELKDAEQRGKEIAERGKVYRKDELDSLRESVESFEKATGIDISRASYNGYTLTKEIGDAVRIVLNNDIHELHENIKRIKQISERITREAEVAMNEINNIKKTESNDKGTV